MTPRRFRWLHLTDLHVGLSPHRRRSVEAEFLEDLEEVHRKTDGIDAVLFTGDLYEPRHRRAVQHVWLPSRDGSGWSTAEFGPGEVVVLGHLGVEVPVDQPYSDSEVPTSPPRRGRERG